MKIAAARAYGATVDTSSPDIPAAFEHLDRLVEETGRTLVHPYDDPLVMAGQGTVGLEMLEDVPEADVVLVPVGGGGLVSGIATAVKELKPDARVLAVEPELSNALGASIAAGESVTVEPRSLADGLNGPYAGPNCVRICIDVGVESVLVTEDEIKEGFRFMYGRMKLACEAAGAATAAALLAGKIHARARQHRRRGRLGRQRGCANGRCYPGRAMKTGIHPEYVVATVRCSCGNEFVTRSTKPELHVEVCSNCHPFYTGKQKLMDTGGRVERFQRRLEKAGAASAGASRDNMAVSYGGQAVLEGVMMRGPSNWSVAVRKPDGEIAHVSRHIDSPMKRHAYARLPVIRGIVALGESLAIGFRALAISANYAAQEENGEEGDIPQELSRGQLFFAFAVAIGFAIALFKVTPALLTDLLPISDTGLFVVVEGLIRVSIFILYLVAHLAPAGPAPRLPVPRGGAQGDQRARSG